MTERLSALSLYGLRIWSVGFGVCRPKSYYAESKGVFGSVSGCVVLSKKLKVFRLCWRNLERENEFRRMKYSRLIVLFNHIMTILLYKD